MSNPTAPTVEIELDRTRHLLFDFNALAEIEEKLKESSLTAEFWKKISASRAIVILWAGLLHEDADLTVDAVRKLIKGKQPTWIIEKLTEAWGAASPESENPPTATQIQ